MTRIVQQNPTIAVRFLPRVVIAVLVAVLLAASVADAALTTGKCLVQKHLAWDNLRSCQRKTQVKRLKGKIADNGEDGIDLRDSYNLVSPCKVKKNGDSGIELDTGSSNQITATASKSNNVGVRIGCPSTLVDVKASGNPGGDLIESGGSCTKLNAP